LASYIEKLKDVFPSMTCKHKLKAEVLEKRNDLGCENKNET
jgi:hypothetical protein